MSESIEILRVLVGSVAHGLAIPDSDKDFRGVFVASTTELLKIGGSVKTTEWKEDENDETKWELGHFLQLAIKSNPSILEVFKAPIVSCPSFPPYKFNYELGLMEPTINYGKRLLELFDALWSSKGVYNSFLGYSHNQHKRLFDEKAEFSKRRGKYAVAHLRVLLEGIELLRTGSFSVQVKDYYVDDDLHIHLPPWAIEWLEKEFGLPENMSESWVTYLRRIKTSNPPIGNIVDTAQYLKDELRRAYEANPHHEVDLGKVNEFLLSVRKEIW